MKPTRIAAVLATAAFALVVASTVAAQLKSPDDVKTGLKLLVQYPTTSRQITAKARAYRTSTWSTRKPPMPCAQRSRMSLPLSRLRLNQG
jgi:hypothetical protein